MALHSVRRGAVQACVAGLGVDALKEAGPWTSNANENYPSMFFSLFF